jgi:two-component system sensor histidine kinase YesM
MNSICHGQMETRVEIQTKDEIGQMADNFNNMLDRLKAAQVTEQRMIYRHLSDQISPHFLCNALDMVCMSAKLRQQTDISDAIELISRYFRTNLSAAGGTVSIGEEFAYIRDYIEITNLIRDIPVTYDLDIEEDLASFQIPRFIIQPFVENALRHGFRSKLRNCHIDLQAARRAPDQVILMIEDNGSGMSDERLAYVRNQTTSDEEESPEIGITNSIRRMRIYFGERFDCTFESYPEVGTRVLLTIML